MQTILVTGATGFIGRHIINALRQQGSNVIALVRTKTDGLNLPAQNILEVGCISEVTPELLSDKGINAVIHLAAKVHDTNPTDDSEFFKINTEATLNLASACKELDVNHFIFMSSIKVNGESSGKDSFNAKEVGNPEDSYGLSKKQAEQGLAKLASNEFKVSVVRVPLVYGEGVKANFRSLVRLIRKYKVSPFAWVRNKRSILGIDNLVDFILALLQKTSNTVQYERYCIADPHPLSLPQLIDNIALAENTKHLQIPVPNKIMTALFALIGKSDAWHKLSSNLEVSCSCAHGDLGWYPPFTTEQQLRNMISGSR